MLRMLLKSFQIKVLGSLYSSLSSSNSGFAKNLSEVQKIFKELYFQCNGTTYDKNSGRVCKMEFEQIYATN